MAVPPESVLVSDTDTDTDRFNSLIGAKVMVMTSSEIIAISPEQIIIMPSSAGSISPGHTP